MVFPKSHLISGCFFLMCFDVLEYIVCDILELGTMRIWHSYLLDYCNFVLVHL